MRRDRPPDAHNGRAPRRIPPYAVGIVNFHEYSDLEICLRSVKAQSVAPVRVVVVDGDPDQSELAAARERHPEVVWKPRPNEGYARAANRILDHLRGEAAEFFLILNPDTELEVDFAEQMLRELSTCPMAALASGKLLRSDTGLIDSAGIVLPRHRRPQDRGSEEPDRGQYERTEFVFGASGAALMIRRTALEDLAIDGEVFDEDFFMYHEDTDLAWRAGLLGWRVLYVPAALGRHTRTWQRSRRLQIPGNIRRHSFKNHYLQLIKNERPSDFLLNLPVIVAWEVLRLGFALARDRALLGGYRDAWRYSARAWKKRRILHERAGNRSRPSAWNRMDSARSSATLPGVDGCDQQARRDAV